jgi:hypothetical protein
LSIRACETCHGIPSLHNIQFATQPFGFPSDGTVVPGQETPWSGHIGNQIDCNGCHGFDNVTVQRAMVPTSGPVVPGLYTVSASSVQSGASVELGGTGFVNLVQNPMTGEYDIELASDVILTGANGSETVIVPDSVAGDTINVTLGGVAPGSYKIAAKKASRNSNPLNVTITPAASIVSATCADGTVTIAGSGFSGYLDAADSGTKVEAWVTYRVGDRKKGTDVTEYLAADISSWSDAEIVGSFPACPDDTVDVTTVFDAASATVGFACVPTDWCQGDFGHDGDVYGSDLAVFSADFGRTDCDQGEICEGDFVCDNDVDGSDLAAIAGNFGTDCPIE